MSDAATACAYCSTPLPESGRFCPNCGRSTARSNVEDPLIGQIIMGQFTVESRLGRGGWATVYLAHQMAMDRKVAIRSSV